MRQLENDDNLIKLKELVVRFKNNVEDYHSSIYDEENTKIDFIDKFFTILGWDVYNETSASEDFREVVREDKVVIQGRPKSPDYSFKIGRERQFFVEAKKPSVNIYFDVKSAFQLRRYAYTAGLSISILTNFEEFAIYDSGIKPNQFDNSSVARIFYCKFDEYEKNWDFLFNTISKQAVWQGKLKKFTTDNTKKKGTQSVDIELLKLIETWRITLAKNINLKNKELDVYQLNEAVQTIIDRIVFLRMAEDQNTEIYGTLQKLASQKNIYDILVKYFDSSNKKYNSGLFAENSWLAQLIIDDKIFKTIIHDLYYPMPYEFSVLPIEILGQIYEQFLGKTITINDRHVADVIEKPEVRKAGGVYYTPKYIVDYIVENTVGNKIENKAPKDVESITILDPACGSGSFLVGAYKFLLNYYLKYYLKSENIKRAIKESKIYEARENDYRITIREKRKILLNNIFGVDIDFQAVEVTKLSLLLTLMEGEIVESRGEIFLKSMSEALLPNLDNNIKCGNSLIGTDFYKDKDLKKISNDELRKRNCFNLELEYKNIMNSGGFDCVIGNPPYGAEFSSSEKEYLKNKFHANDVEFESYLAFIEKSFNLLKITGRNGLIVPSNLLTNVRYNKIRELVLNKYKIHNIIDLGSSVFKDASVDTCIIISENKTNGRTAVYTYIGNISSVDKIKYNVFRQNDFRKNANLIFNIYISNEDKNLIAKIKSNKQELCNLVEIHRGIEFGYKSDIVSSHQEKEFKPIIAGRCFSRYYLKFDNKYVKFDENDLSNFKTKRIYESEKIFVRRIGKNIKAYLDKEKFYNVCDVYNLILQDNQDISLTFLLGILNSKLMSYYLEVEFKNAKVLFPKIPISSLQKLPIININLKNKSEKSQYDHMISIVEQMLETQKEAHSYKIVTEKDKKLINQRIEILDNQIDELVYELYELTEEEIKRINELTN